MERNEHEKPPNVVLNYVWGLLKVKQMIGECVSKLLLDYNVPIAIYGQIGI